MDGRVIEDMLIPPEVPGGRWTVSFQWIPKTWVLVPLMLGFVGLLFWASAQWLDHAVISWFCGGMSTYAYLWTAKIVRMRQDKHHVSLRANHSNEMVVMLEAVLAHYKRLSDEEPLEASR